MTAIAKRITATPAGSPQEMALRIKREAPGLADLAPDQLEMIAKLVMTQRLAAEMNTAVDLAGIEWQKERDTFLSDTKSPHTRRAYDAALGRLETWASREGLNCLQITAAQADHFIRDLKAEGRAAASIRRDVAAVSAFYSWLERYYAAIKNPIRGTRVRPPNKPHKEIIAPDKKDYKIIMENVPKTERAILAVLAFRGLRAGALSTLEKKGSYYKGTSKGKALTEGRREGITMPTAALAEIKAAGLDEKKPFAGLTANAIERRINYHIGKLHKAGKIKAAYSCHDFRHFYAVTEYEKDKDIVRVSKLLNHASLTITERYLISLGIDV